MFSWTYSLVDIWPTATDDDARAVSHPIFLRFCIFDQRRQSMGYCSWEVVFIEYGSSEENTADFSASP